MKLPGSILKPAFPHGPVNIHEGVADKEHHIRTAARADLLPDRRLVRVRVEDLVRDLRLREPLPEQRHGRIHQGAEFLVVGINGQPARVLRKDEVRIVGLRQGLCSAAPGEAPSGKDKQKQGKRGGKDAFFHTVLLSILPGYSLA